MGLEQRQAKLDRHCSDTWGNQLFGQRVIFLRNVEDAPDGANGTVVDFCCNELQVQGYGRRVWG